jgi:rod shape determining protein RodA
MIEDDPIATPISKRPAVKSHWYHAVNFPLLLVVVLLSVYGLIVVQSVITGDSNYSITKQIAGVAVGVVIMIVLWRMDYRSFANWFVPLLVVDIALMLSPHLPFIGVSVNGATSWIRIAGQQIQPGEPAKIVTILLMASMVSRYRGRIVALSDYLKVLALLFIPFLCVMTQPDLGSGLVILVIGFIIMFTGGASWKWLLITFAVFILFVAGALLIDPILDAAAGHDVFIKTYQMNRLLVFINNDIDPTGVGYNLKQAKIAIGSGSLWGKGLGNATQATLGFLPEAATDFIFCALAESLGFMGSLGLILLYALLIACAIYTMARSNDLFGTLIIAGVIGMWVFQILENIGMDCGLMPITGIPLPFMSYGSSFMLTNFMAVGLILSVWRLRKQGK